MKKFLMLFPVVMLAGLLAWAGAIKVWYPGDVLNSSDLNANFAHIHNLMVGGHGARLIDADVNASAGIALSKLATPGLLPKAWTYVATTCTTSPCTQAASQGMGSVTRITTGQYQANLANLRPNNAYMALTTVVLCGTAPDRPCTCNTEPPQAGYIGIDCYNRSGAAIDVAFQMVFFDDNN